MAYDTFRAMQENVTKETNPSAEGDLNRGNQCWIDESAAAELGTAINWASRNFNHECGVSASAVMLHP